MFCVVCNIGFVGGAIKFRVVGTSRDGQSKMTASSEQDGIISSVVGNRNTTTTDIHELIWIDGRASVSNEGIPITSVWTKYNIQQRKTSNNLIAGLSNIAEYQQQTSANAQEDLSSTTTTTTRTQGVQDNIAYIEVVTSAKAILVIEKEGIFRRLCEDNMLR